MKNKIVIIVFFLTIIFGSTSPFWDSFVVIEAFFGVIPLLLLLLISFVLIIINSISKNKKISDPIISLLIPFFIATQITSTFLVDKLQKFRSESLSLIQKQKKKLPENIETPTGIKYHKIKGEETFVISFSRGFLITEKYYSDEDKWRSYGWND